MAVRKKKALTSRKKAGSGEETPRKATAKSVTIIPPKAPPVRVVKVDPEQFVAAPTPNKVKLHVIRIPASEGGGEEPVWDTATIKVGEQHHLGKGLNWYHSALDTKHYRKCFEEWIQATMVPKSADKFLKRLAKIPDKWLSGTLAAAGRMHLRGYPLPVSLAKKIVLWFDEVEENAARAAEMKIPAPEKETREVVSIQDRIVNQVRPVLAEIDALADALLDGDPADVSEVKTLLHNPEFKAPQYRKIADHIEKYLREWDKALQARKTAADEEAEDYAEAYRLVTLRQLKNAVTAFATLNSETRGTIEAVKTPRKRRARSVEKMVAKVKYLASCPELGITSVEPKDCLGASVVFLFNCKRRKLTMLLGEFSGSIDVKRSTLIGVNLKTSFSKTLRKPEEQLRAFLDLRKGASEKWFNAVRSKGRPARARMNAETLILMAE